MSVRGLAQINEVLAHWAEDVEISLLRDFVSRLRRLRPISGRTLILPGTGLLPNTPSNKISETTLGSLVRSVG